MADESAKSAEGRVMEQPCMTSFRGATPEQLAAAMLDARSYTLALFECFAAVGLDALDRVPFLPIVNPPLWELAHVAWFSELFLLRDASSSNPATALYPSLLTGSDDCFDSNGVPHRARWTLNLPATAALKTYCRDVFEGVLDKLSRVDNDNAALYPYRLALAHEDMHGEAFTYTLQTLDVPAPPQLASPVVVTGAAAEIRFAGGAIYLGSRPDQGFVFDNEKWAHLVVVPAFTIDSDLISNAQYTAFVEDGGYETPALWRNPAGDWLARQNRAAQAYCLWAGRRLPTEAEWEFAALSGSAAFRWGDLWEWTSSPFEPYPGFAPDAYREYSAPWFKTHQVLRGASFATQARMRSPVYRNFFMPHRDDLFAGFRTCAL